MWINKVVPTFVTYNTLLNRLRKKGKELRKPKKLASKITNGGLKHDAITYNCLFYGYSVKGDRR